MHVGDWVSLAYKGEITRGFILRKSESEVKIQVTSTLHGARASEIITVPEGDTWPIEYILSPEDIPDMIELALMTKDKEWFQFLVHELGLWRPVGEVFMN
ncbi:hypothetical protein ERICIV_02233 [Paenibacillus larvae subsp. larvae]|uniref:Terminase small subunit n=5 Tax=root TaxID=1 RepID=A0A345AVM8_9CAUD|nr:hypothetical protein [Paenibacillus larvae]YP_010082259.1 terminase small subunit [Paenibacillus phage Halcyone]YP_010082440.1 terminase small subunit [Paenibacillus phage Unity]AXF40961.1 terminase small subunit [Paenibacillus phage Heath]MED1158422.1 hypothetical protein [Bacillus paranthracis]MED2910442.1 hypothetical protein [Bacillus thuringiensis]AQZ48376.1 hypothetical protein B5S25_19065 [Paenibacillus larvae subsp. pulvifaciens]AVF26373.1 hypothetical protein ERICIII_02212 [Paeni